MEGRSSARCLCIGVMVSPVQRNQILNQMKRFSAPWGRGLKWASLLSTLLCIGLGCSALFLPHIAHLPKALFWTLLPLIAVPFGAALFVVRGFSVKSGTLLVHRLLWDTTIDLSALKSAEVVPNAMRGSIRTFGNGGMFSFTGRYWSKALSHYRAFVNDWTAPVVLRCESKTYVLSTDDAQGFIAAVGTPP
jgi:Bacterial PH domain